MRILLAQINPTVGDLQGNFEKIINSIEIGKKNAVDVVLFPELALCGYPPDDFLLLSNFTNAIDAYLEKIIAASKGICTLVGMPKRNPCRREKTLCNSAAIIHDGTLIGFQDKALLPTYDVFDERRYFEPTCKTFAWNIKGKKIGVTICEDLWQRRDVVKNTAYLQDPIKDLIPQNPEIILNLSASPFRVNKWKERLDVCKEAARATRSTVLLCNQVGGNDSLIFDGHSLYVSAEGHLLAMAKGFEEDHLIVDLEEPQEPIQFSMHKTEELFNALVLGIKDYFQKLGFKKACLGLSGGIDSAVVATIASYALGKDNLLALIMPSRYSSEGGIQDALQLVKNLQIQHKILSIESPFESYLTLLEPHFEARPFDTTEENLQARIRGMILMAFSNKFGYIVLSTGNKSEMAMGYATLYGDMCGGLGVISDVTKMQVFELARWINRKQEIIPKNILEKPPSAELKEKQLDSDTLPDYAIVDTVLKAYVEEHMDPKEIAEKFHYPIDLVHDLIKKIHINEYKRRQGPPGLRVSEKAFTVGRRFPIVQKWV